MHINTSEEWAQLIFGNANLGDPRRTRRLALLASDMAENADSSIVKASDTPAKLKPLIVSLEMRKYPLKRLPIRGSHKRVKR